MLADEFHYSDRVLRGIRIRHCHDSGKPTKRGTSAASLDGLRLFATGFTKVNMQIDEAGTDDQPGRVDELLGTAVV